MSLASCSKEVTAAEAKKQADTYSQDDASAKYSGGQAKAEMTITSDNEKVKAALTLLGIESGKTTATTISTDIVVITSADITEFAAEYDSQYIKYYINGSAVSVKANYSGTIDEDTYGISGTAAITAEFTTNGEGLATYSYSKISYTNAKMGSTDVGSFSTEAKISYTYTKK